MKVEGSHVHVLRSSPSWPFGQRRQRRQREVAVPYRWGRVRLCKRYGVICTATPRHPGRPIMSHARAGRCATGVHRCFMRPGISTPAVRGATARRVALTRGRVASYSTSASAAALDHEHEHEPLTSPLPVAARFSGVAGYHGPDPPGSMREQGWCFFHIPRIECLLDNGA